jgi:hypothetical protein
MLHDSSTLGVHLWLWPEVDLRKLMRSYCPSTFGGRDEEWTMAAA